MDGDALIPEPDGESARLSDEVRVQLIHAYADTYCRLRQNASEGEVEVVRDMARREFGVVVESEAEKIADSQFSQVADVLSWLDHSSAQELHTLVIEHEQKSLRRIGSCLKIYTDLCEFYMPEVSGDDLGGIVLQPGSGVFDIDARIKQAAMTQFEPMIIQLIADGHLLPQDEGKIAELILTQPHSDIVDLVDITQLRTTNTELLKTVQEQVRDLAGRNRVIEQQAERIAALEQPAATPQISTSEQSGVVNPAVEKAARQYRETGTGWPPGGDFPPDARLGGLPSRSK